MEAEMCDIVRAEDAIEALSSANYRKKMKRTLYVDIIKQFIDIRVHVCVIDSIPYSFF